LIFFFLVVAVRGSIQKRSRFHSRTTRRRWPSTHQQISKMDLSGETLYSKTRWSSAACQKLKQKRKWTPEKQKNVQKNIYPFRKHLSFLAFSVLSANICKLDDGLIADLRVFLELRQSLLFRRLQAARASAASTRTSWRSRSSAGRTTKSSCNAFVSVQRLSRSFSATAL
jgi:hypothetical protein